MNAFLIIFLVCLIVSAIGWMRFIYFISLGYGFSIATAAIAILLIFRESMTWATLALCVLLMIYGFRLGFYLLLRELKSSEYRKVLSENVRKEGYSFGVTLAIHLSCALLYLSQVAPVVSRLYNMDGGVVMSEEWAWIGASVMFLGIIIEAAADAQKSFAKKKNAHRFVDTGLYRIVRCPNYFGEVIMWTGCLLVCIGASCTWWQWAFAVFGYVCIVYIMFSGARRLEIRQNKNYGSDPEYQKYVKNTPILIPLVPIYSVERHKWLKG